MGTKSACPKLCHCKWRDGKETVACPNAGFIDIPRGLDSTTQVLDLRRNNLKILPNDAFLDTGLVNLQKVWLNFCELKYIIDGAFRHLANLIELDLSDNLLTTIPSIPLADISGLRNLLISKNLITKIPEDAFKSVPLLVKLDLSHNNISVVHEDAFAFLNRLEDLKLSFNKLKTLPVNVLQPLAALHGLHVDNNPWNCNCHLRLLRQWLLQRNVAASIPPKCASPERLKDRKWQTLNENEFVCVPLLTAVAQKVIAAHGDNVTLACKVETDDDAAVTWLVGEKAVVNASEETQRKYSVLELGAAGNGARVSNLTIEGAAVQDQGTYRCVVENKAGRVETNLTLKVSEEVDEVPLIVKKEEPFPQWIFGAAAGGVGVVLLLIIIITFRFRRKRTLLRKNPLVNVELGDKENVDGDSTTDSLSQTVQFLSSDQICRQDTQCSSLSGEDLPCSSLSRDDSSDHLMVHSGDKKMIKNLSPISYVDTPNMYLPLNTELIDLSYLEAMIGNQFKQINPQNLLQQHSTRFPDLLNHPQSSSRGDANVTSVSPGTADFKKEVRMVDRRDQSSSFMQPAISMVSAFNENCHPSTSSKADIKQNQFTATHSNLHLQR